MNILALDLGTKCGWARSINGQRASGTWILAKSKELKAAKEEHFDRTGDLRFYELLRRISLECLAVPEGQQIDMIVFEDVLFSAYTLQTQLWSSLRAAVWVQARVHGARVDCLNTSSLKVFGAHHGGATKLMMGAWLVKKHPELYSKNPKPKPTCFVLAKDGREIDDNEVDANHLLDYFLQQA